MLEFVIPLKRENLLEASDDRYHVADVIAPDLVSKKLEECALRLKKNGAAFILDDFEIIYSALSHFGELDWQDVHFMYDKIIMKSLFAVHENCERILEELMNSDNRSNDERIQALNILKMNVYILSQYFQAYNIKISQKSENVAVIKVKGRRKKTDVEDHAKEHSWDWEEKQRDGLVKLSLLLQLPLINLWDPPVAEETFANTAAECCYRLLEQSSITLVKSRSLKTTVILILGILIKQYNHGLSFVVKSIQLMKRFEHVCSVLAEAVTNYVNHFGCKSLIKHFLEEIVEASGDLLSSTSDQHAGKSFATFLTEITEANPYDMEPLLEYIFPFVDSELPALRMLGLSVMTAIFLGCLSKEDISEEAEAKRDKCLELLEENILDVNAFVRAKDLQMWQKIVSYGALPKDWLIRLMEAAIGIMMDKSSIVTKQAIHLVRIMMESNPFAAKLSVQELVTTLEQEKLAYTQLAAQDENNLNQNVGEECVWNEVEPELKIFLEDFFKEGGNAELPSSQDSPLIDSPMKSSAARFTTINKYITEKNFSKAFKLLVHAENTMPVLKELRKGIQLGNVEFYLHFFKKIFLEHQSALPLEKIAGTPIKQPPLTPSKRPATRKLLELNENAPEDEQAQSVLSTQKARVAFYTSCVEFAKRLSKAVELVTSLMKSKNVFEVVEAVEFIKMAKQFGVSGSEMGVIEMMKLIQCPEESIRSAATRALEVLYIQVEEGGNPESVAKQVVKNLCSLVKNMKLSQRELLHTLMAEWLKTNSLNEYCVAAMLAVFMMEDAAVTPEESCLALTLVSCVVSVQPKLVNENLESFIDKGLMRGLKSSQTKDLRIVANVCNILKLATSSHSTKRFRNNHKIFTTLTKVIEENFLYFRENNYLLMVENSLDLIFKIAMKPGVLCQNIINILLTKAFGSKNNVSNIADSTADISSVSTNSNNPDIENTDPNVSGVSVLRNDKGNRKIHEEALARLVFILGHSALRLCFYFENDVLDERKKRLRNQYTDENKSNKNQKSDDEDDELNMAVDMNAANDDSLVEEIQALCENKILYGDGLIARNVKLPIYILQNEGKYSSRIVSIASVALGKFMLISRKFCRENIQMFVTILEKSADTSVKVNLIIVFGELLPRFPNVIEPWISYVYLRLRDECKDVRLNTLYVLSHLITNELVKIKGQISDVALCIVDEEETIKDAAQRLFQELSTKGNTLYNLLTDIISTLSNPNAEKPLDEESFKIILRFLMDLVQKEKQMEHLVEKLSIRLRESQSERQWSDLAFCLSLLSYSDRSVRKLVDNFVCFKDKLHHPPVYNCLTGIISNANKSSKSGLKEAASELDAVIKEVLDTGSENWVQATPRNANGPRVRPSTAKRAVRGRSCKKKMDFSDSDSNSDSGLPKTRTKRTTKKAIKYDSSDESEGEPRTKTKRTAKKISVRDSDDGSGDDIFVPPVPTRNCRKRIVS
ncbi:hypothetical protein LSTR_LSTR004574 [Laodelphax striatellus]|uniref:Condensin complex subunit 1 n=1 Tax=Laodelphax striatellus TaxID=195883 RepID=A0A482WUB3_LAOST|nr:hypothetical protein LSTR_LSTR004574 [Laodelphax striatellus]